MKTFLKRYAVYVVLLAAFSVNSAAQGVQEGHEAASQNAWTTRQALNQTMQVYPPTLREVLQRDSSLLDNAAYMATYPKVLQFIKEHPEVPRNPAYFFGSPFAEEPRVIYRGSNTRDILQFLALTGVTISLVGLLIWLVRSVGAHRRWLRQSKLQTEANAKLMDRFSSNEDLLAFIQTPAGKRFLESSSVPPEPQAVGAPISRILWSIQIGVVMWVAGAGMQFVSTRVVEEASDVFYVLGVLAMAVGLGFVLSGIASYVLSRRFGLFDRPVPESADVRNTIS